ncbi:MAG: ornithine carbamoyltransferase [Planctomycetota bacterium]
MAINFKGRCLLSLNDLSSDEVLLLLEGARVWKQQFYAGNKPPVLKGKTLGMIFQKPSTRTRVSFEVAMHQLGGQALYLGANDLQLKRGETIADTARVLSRYVDALIARVYAHQDVVDLAQYATIPVINALSDYSHPCQGLADLFTILEKKGTFKDIKITYLGDGNNVVHSLMFGIAKVGGYLCVATPKGYEPNAQVVALANAEAQKTKARIEIVTDPIKAVREADVIYTDVWTSMGQEAEHDQRIQIFKPYQINAQLTAQAKSDALIMHCLPAHRGEEITDEVIDGPNSIVWEQAENRLHLQKALLVQLMR